MLSRPIPHCPSEATAETNGSASTIDAVNAPPSCGTNGLTEDCLAAGDLIAVVLAIVLSATILLLSHPVDPRAED
jgi:hypothetical protein